MIGRNPPGDSIESTSGRSRSTRSTEDARNGSGVNVYVIDSGIRINHAEFGGRAFIAGDYVDDDGDGDSSDVSNDDLNGAVPDGEDCHGHGTHVAGIVGGTTSGVAKNVTLWSHRILDCSGFGSASAVIAAVDAITADTTRRPAVAVIGLSAPAGTALDAAIRQSIASGVTYVAAAGNEGRDVSFTSPARLAHAISVGATTSSDARASFSNFGPAVDLFAPGVSIPSAAISNDTAAVTSSGTSMAAAHVAGVAALYLETRTGASPSDVQAALIAASTPGAVKSAGLGSPNRLLYSPPGGSWVSDESALTGSTTTTAGVPSLTVTSPAIGGELGRRFEAADLMEAQYRDQEVCSDRGEPRRGSDVQRDRPVCEEHQPSSGTYTWTVTGPNTSAALIRVTSTDGAVSDVSDQPFTIAAPFIQLTAPNGGDTWVTGTTGTMTWLDNLGSLESVALHLSLNGGTSYSTVLRSSTRSDGMSSIYVLSSWLTESAKVRIRWMRNMTVKTRRTTCLASAPQLRISRRPSR